MMQGLLGQTQSPVEVEGTWGLVQVGNNKRHRLEREEVGRARAPTVPSGCPTARRMPTRRLLCHRARPNSDQGTLDSQE